MTTMTEIKMLGPMGKRFGRSHWVSLATKTTAEAVRWLLANFPDARRYLSTAHEKGIAFAVFRGRGPSRENIGRDQLHEPAGDCITFAPVHQGAKSGGVLQVVVGAVLIVAGVIVSGASFGAASPLGGAMIATGIGMVAGGVIQMLSAKPKLNQANPADQQASYIFSGAVNTTAQGNPVPVCYGRMRIGSAVISAGIEAEDYSSAQSNVGAGTPNGNKAKTPFDVLAD